MRTWRDIRTKGLTKVHAFFGVPVVYWTHSAGTPILISARLHTKPTQVNWPDGPDFLAQIPTLIFSESEIAKVLPESYVFVSATEVYRTGASYPARNGYISVEVSDATATDVASMTTTLDMTNLALLWSGILP